ncbi:MAG: hypothetical protein QF535_14740 [Anaerolineales bacterium]|jgi:exonuclease III|nr:hypothetical protein [Anaerolineales bacterium]
MAQAAVTPAVTTTGTPVGTPADFEPIVNEFIMFTMTGYIRDIYFHPIEPENHEILYNHTRFANLREFIDNASQHLHEHYNIFVEVIDMGAMEIIPDSSDAARARDYEELWWNDNNDKQWSRSVQNSNHVLAPFAVINNMRHEYTYIFRGIVYEKFFELLRGRN